MEMFQFSHFCNPRWSQNIHTHTYIYIDSLYGSRWMEGGRIFGIWAGNYKSDTANIKNEKWWILNLGIWRWLSFWQYIMNAYMHAWYDAKQTRRRFAFSKAIHNSNSSDHIISDQITVTFLCMAAWNQLLLAN